MRDSESESSDDSEEEEEIVRRPSKVGARVLII